MKSSATIPTGTTRPTSSTGSVQPELIELMCWICQKPFMGSGKRHNRICDKPRCAHVRNVISGILRRERESSGPAAHCQLCDGARSTGSKYCERHQHRKCRTCGGTCGCGGCVRRNEGQGNQPQSCCKACRRRARNRSTRAFRIQRKEEQHQEEQQGNAHGS